jgi:hypothetical protein
MFLRSLLSFSSSWFFLQDKLMWVAEHLVFTLSTRFPLFLLTDAMEDAWKGPMTSTFPYSCTILFNVWRDDSGGGNWWKRVENGRQNCEKFASKIFPAPTISLFHNLLMLTIRFILFSRKRFRSVKERLTAFFVFDKNLCPTWEIS